MSPLLQLHLAVLLFGGTALFSALIPLPATEITAFRATIASLVLASVVGYRRGHLKLQHYRDYGVITLLGIIVGLHWVSYFAAMQASSVAIGMIAFFTYPVMTVIAEPLLQKRLPKGADLLSAMVVLAGIVLLVPAPTLSNNLTLGVALGVISAALFTARNLIQKRWFSGYDGPTTMAYQTGIAALMLLPWCGQAPTELDAEGLGLLLLLAVVFTALPHALMSQSLRHLAAKTVSLVGCLQPLYGVTLAALVLAQWPDGRTLLGGCLVVCAALFETHQQSSARAKKSQSNR
ncbi:DMT family transporter [Ferrimonas sediminicola]|uniref:DMT family transporter n=1 Tax=Ferrimonas sediminicola TaxID=2569538 RepID=A0A4V5NVP9_9GAMM|nr:DMT family transporter [Ferrimonas sediminicola]TKB51371.1 DMT family transporter [Ferrimonas sediminicola]